MSPVQHLRNILTTVSRASAVNLENSHFLIAQAAPCAEGAITLRQEWCATGVGLAIDHQSLELAAYRVALELTVLTAKSVHGAQLDTKQMQWHTSLHKQFL